MLSRLRGGMQRALPAVPPVDRRTRWVLVAIVAIGALGRFLWALIAAQEPQGYPVPRDPGFYMLLGESVADGDGYSYITPVGQGEVELQSTAYYPPGYPLVLGGLFWLVKLLPFGVSAFGAAVTLNVLLSIATVALVFELGRRLVDTRTGLVAAGVMALWPNVVFHSAVVLTETLFLFLLTVMFLVALATPQVARAPGRWRLVATGLLLGAVVMVRPTSLVFAPLFLLLWWPSGVATAARRTAVVAVGALVVVLPWTLRNAVQLEAPVLISTNMGDNLCIGNHPEANGSFNDAPYCFEGLGEPAPGETRGDFEVRRQSEMLRRARQSVVDDPLQVIGLIPARARYTLDRDADGLVAATDYGMQELLATPRMDMLETGADFYYAVVMVVGLAGAVILLRDDDAARRRRFFLAVAAAQLVPPLLTFGDPRFKVPVYPAIAIGVGAAVVAALRWADGGASDGDRAPARDRREEDTTGTTPPTEGSATPQTTGRA